MLYVECIFVHVQSFAVQNGIYLVSFEMGDYYTCRHTYFDIDAGRRFPVFCEYSRGNKQKR